MSRIGDDQDDEWAKWLAYCEQEQKDGREPPSFAEWRSLDHAFKRWRDARGELADLEEANRRLIERLEELKRGTAA